MKKLRIKKTDTINQVWGQVVWMAVPAMILAFIWAFGSIFGNYRAGPANWTPPRSGWLYIVDHNMWSDTTTYIVLVDPEKGIMGKLEAGYAPDVALSPDGTRLYIASGPTGLSTLSVVDTTSGTVLQQKPIPRRTIYKFRLTASSLAVSRDGRLVYIPNMRTIVPGADEYTIQTFDTMNGTFLPEEAAVPSCGIARPLPAEGEWQLLVHCINSNDIRFLNFTPSGSIAQEASLQVPTELSSVTVGPPENQRTIPRRIAELSPLPEKNEIGIIMDDGTAFKKAAGSPQVESTSAVALPDRLVLPARSSPRSPDGSKAYVAFGSPSVVGGKALGEGIRIFDTRNWSELETIPTSSFFNSLAMSKDGRHLYTVNPEQGSLTIIDSATSKETSTIKGIGKTPSLIIVSP